MDGLNWYVYGNSSPLRYVDQDGQVPLDTIVDVVWLLWDIGRAACGDKNALTDIAIDVAGLAIPYVPAAALKGAKAGAKIVKTTSKIVQGGKGFKSFDALKKFLGSPGVKREWHHIVEQCQIEKTGFAADLIQNTKNVLSIDAETHRKISGYYNTKSFDFTKGKSVRDWLAGQSFEYQYQFGIEVLKKFGVIK